MVSNLLESKGINPDFSLTPIEFHDETINIFDLKEFEIITYYYELARFSDQMISEIDFKNFKTNLEKIYEKFNLLEST